MNQSKETEKPVEKAAEAIDKVKEAIHKVNIAGYSSSEFFVAARRHTESKFDPGETARAFANRSMKYRPPEAVMTFANWVCTTDEKRLKERLDKLFGVATKKARVPFLEEMAAGIA